MQGDEESIRRIVATVLREHGLELDPHGVDADLDDIIAHYHDSGGLFRVVTDEQGAIVGCGGIVPIDANDAEVRKMYLLPVARGLGYGQRLLEDLIAHARSNGFRRVVLETTSNLPRARTLYTRFGFTDVTRNHLSRQCDTAMALELE